MFKIEGKPFNIVIVQCYAPTQDHSDEEIGEYYNEIQECLKLVKSTDVLVVMGDWNAKVGKEETGHITSKFGLGDRNLRGERLIQFCQEENLIVTNTFYQHHKRSTVADPEGGPGGPWPPPQTIRIQHAKINDNIVNTKYSMQTLSTTVCFT